MTMCHYNDVSCRARTGSGGTCWGTKGDLAAGLDTGTPSENTTAT